MCKRKASSIEMSCARLLARCHDLPHTPAKARVQNSVGQGEKERAGVGLLDEAKLERKKTLIYFGELPLAAAAAA